MSRAEETTFTAGRTGFRCTRAARRRSTPGPGRAARGKLPARALITIPRSLSAMSAALAQLQAFPGLGADPHLDRIDEQGVVALPIHPLVGPPVQAIRLGIGLESLVIAQKARGRHLGRHPAARGGKKGPGPGAGPGSAIA